MPNSSECKKLRQVVEDAFSKQWLEQENGQSKLQLVWNRKDLLATLEIINLGQCLSTLQKIDANWVKGVVDETLKGDYGKLFEITCASMFKSGGADVDLMPPNHEGYDAKVSLKGYNLTLLLSIKNHDMSRREEDFRKECKRLREIAQSAFQQINNSGEVIVIAKGIWLQKDHFEWIEQSIRTAQFGIPLRFEQDGLSIDLIKIPLIYDGLPVAPSPLSDIFRIIGGFSANEQTNICSKIDEASLGFQKQNINFDPKFIRCAFVSIHPTADLNRLVTYTKQRLDTDESNPLWLDKVYLYQPAVIRTKNETKIIHHFRVVNSKRLTEDLPLNLNLPFGLLSQDGRARIQIKTPLGNFFLDDHYVFQEGDIFCKTAQTSVDKIELTLRTPAPGILIHAVLPNGEVINAEIFPPDDELQII